MSSTTTSSSFIENFGIPKAPFSEKDEELVVPGEDMEGTLAKFEELLNKYRLMELNLNNKRSRMVVKVEDLAESIEAIKGIQTFKENPFRYELNETLYATAKAAVSNTVHLWLGANVMLAYPISEALDLLTAKLSEAKILLSKTESDLFFLRDQITTMEVNTARVYNLLVKSKSKQ